MLESRKNKLFFFGGIALLVLLTIFAVYAILVTPSRQPYRIAQAQYQNVYNANIAVINAGAALNASTATDEQFAASTQRVIDALDTLEAENEALGEVPVMQDGEPKAQYDAFTEQLNEYLAFNYDMLRSMQVVRPVLFECSRVMTDVTEDEASVAAMRDCSDEFAALPDDIPNEDYAALVVTYQGLYDDFADNLAERAALEDPEGEDKARYDELSGEQEAILEDLNDASATFSEDLNEHKAEVDITEAAITLDEYLADKASIF